MNGRYLLDTNIVITLFADESAVKGRFGEAEEVFVPSIVLEELYYGARKSRRVVENPARIDDFAARNVVLGCDTETARRYGEEWAAAEGSPRSRERHLDSGDGAAERFDPCSP